jgi:hypothetical protein
MRSFHASAHTADTKKSKTTIKKGFLQSISYRLTFNRDNPGGLIKDENSNRFFYDITIGGNATDE